MGHPWPSSRVGRSCRHGLPPVPWPWLWQDRWRCLHPAPTQAPRCNATPQPGRTPIAHAGLPTLMHFYFLQSFAICLRLGKKKVKLKKRGCEKPCRQFALQMTTPSNPTPTGIAGTEPWSSGWSKRKLGPPAALPAGRWPGAAGPQVGCMASARDRLRTARIRQSFSKPSPSSWSCCNPASPANPAAGLGAPSVSHVLLLPKGRVGKEADF